MMGFCRLDGAGVKRDGRILTAENAEIAETERAHHRDHGDHGDHGEEED
jgi:hypothetical protein